MKTKTQKLFLIMMTGIIISCTNSVPPAYYIVLTTTPVTGITPLTATSGGIINSAIGGAITAKGVCWGATINPTTANSKTTDGTGASNFSSTITGLISSTAYHVRAYATNSSGTYYGDDVLFGTTPVICDGVSDIDGNVYNTVTIGAQCWMKENLKTTHYNDGTSIPTGLSNAAWQYDTTGAYAIYNNDPANNTIYGKLYNWYAVHTGKLAPAGWHVPTDAEWTILTNYLGGESIAGNKMKAATSWPPYTGIVNTNSSGFTGLPAGTRLPNGTFVTIGDNGYFWSSTESTTTTSWTRYLTYSSSNAGRDCCYGKEEGFSVRCVRD